MDKQSHINQLADEAMGSADNAKRATPPPYLSTRVNSRINKAANAYFTNPFYFISKPAVAIGALIFLITINITALLLNESYTIVAYTAQSAPDIADENTDNLTSIYDIVNIEP